MPRWNDSIRRFKAVTITCFLDSIQDNDFACYPVLKRYDNDKSETKPAGTSHRRPPNLPCPRRKLHSFFPQLQKRLCPEIFEVIYVCSFFLLLDHFSRFFHRKYHRKNNDPCDYGAFWCSPEQLFCLTEKVGSWEGSKSKQFRNWRFKQLNWNNQSVSNHLYIRQNVFWNPVNYPVPTDRITKIVHNANNAKSILPDGGSGVPGYLGV